MIVKVGLGVRFNIHNLTNQRYFVAANAAGAFSTEPPPAVWAGLPGSRCGDAATHARATNPARLGLARRPILRILAAKGRQLVALGADGPRRQTHD